MSQPLELSEEDLTWRLSHHARLRARELGFSVTEVLLAAGHPEQSYCAHPAYGADNYIHQRGDIAVAVIPPIRLVKTVLLRRTDRWRHGRDAR